MLYDILDVLPHVASFLTDVEAVQLCILTKRIASRKSYAQSILRRHVLGRHVFRRWKHAAMTTERRLCTLYGVKTYAELAAILGNESNQTDSEKSGVSRADGTWYKMSFLKNITQVPTEALVVMVERMMIYAIRMQRRGKDSDSDIESELQDDLSGWVVTERHRLLFGRHLLTQPFVRKKEFTNATSRDTLLALYFLSYILHIKEEDIRLAYYLYMRGVTYGCNHKYYNAFYAACNRLWKYRECGI